MVNNIRVVTNSENNVVKTFKTDDEFLDYAQKVYKQYEEGQPYKSTIHWLPENIQQATEYIVEYCSNLELVD